MPIGPQPPGRRGTVGHPYSALNLRLVLAGFWLITSTVFAVLLLRAGVKVFGIVVQRRRRARNRAHGGGHSLFE
jgi:hypothetical protein